MTNVLTLTVLMVDQREWITELAAIVTELKDVEFGDDYMHMVDADDYQAVVEFNLNRLKFQIERLRYLVDKMGESVVGYCALAGDSQDYESLELN